MILSLLYLFVAVKNVSTFRETTPTHGLFGPRRLRMTQKGEERRNKGEEREQKHCTTLCFYIGDFKEKKQQQQQ